MPKITADEVVKNADFGDPTTVYSVAEKKSNGGKYRRKLQDKNRHENAKNQKPIFKKVRLPDHGIRSMRGMSFEELDEIYGYDDNDHNPRY